MPSGEEPQRGVGVWAGGMNGTAELALGAPFKAALTQAASWHAGTHATHKYSGS